MNSNPKKPKSQQSENPEWPLSLPEKLAQAQAGVQSAQAALDANAQAQTSNAAQIRLAEAQASSSQAALAKTQVDIKRAEPLLARATSYLALDKAKEAAVDLDEAVEADPQNGQIWSTRGQAYERLGDRAKAADSYSRAVNLRPRDEAARSGLARVGGKPG